MSLFSKSKEKIEAEKLYSLISDKTSKFTIDQIKETIRQQGYSEKISSLVVRMILDNKLPLKNTTPTSPKNKTKEDVLKELSQTVTTSKNISKKEPVKEVSKENIKPDSRKEPLKETSKKEKSLENISKVGFFKKTKNFFKRIYFFFEDNYYRMIDGISKVVPINKVTDGIDKVFPSFILFILILALLIYLLLSGGLSFSKSWTLVVEVNDPSNTPLNDVIINLKISDNLVSTEKTNVFGEVIFRDFKSRKQDVTLELTKTNYNPKEHVFRLSKDSLVQKITLDINTDSPDINSVSQEREIIFVENNNQLITSSNLNVTFTCSNTEKYPVPRNTLVSTGKKDVETPAGCGSLRVSVTSNDFSSVSNRVIGEDNKVVLSRINQDRGKLGFAIKNMSGDALPGSDVTLFNNSQSSLFPLDTLKSDLYGLGEFSLEPKQYLLTASKDGFLTHPRKGPLTVVKDSSVNTEIRLFTLQELINFNCQDSKYQDYCVDQEIDCQNEHLKPFLNIKSDGSCTIGTPGYIDVTLKDKDSGEPVFADITLESKLKDSDQNFSFSDHIALDTNHYVFNVIDFYDYKVRVINTENKGYLSPDPVVVTNLDSNIVVSLEYSSELNSGKIGVNVKNNGLNISNSRVYLYREVDDDFVLVTPTPQLTNQFGDANFSLQRADRDYYAYSIHNLLDKEGTSSIQRLDVNSYLELSVELEDIPKILNLKVNPNISYDVNFYDALHNPVTDYVTLDVDSNKQYYFLGPQNKIYAIVTSQGYTTYQTEVITLIPDQEVFKEITLSNLSSCQDSRLEILGFYDKSGIIPVENIDFINNTLGDEYRVKLKYTSCLKDAEEKYAHIRTGNQIFIDDDYLALLSEEINVEDVSVKRGYKFSGEHIPDFNGDLFSSNYSSDRQYNYSGNNYKWLEIDFRELVPDILEFSVNLEFRETPIAPIDYYLLNYRSIATKYNQVYSYDPSLESSWDSIPYYPEGYFYAESNKYQIPFLNTDYIYQTKLKDSEGALLEGYYDGYNVSIDNDYKYDLEYLYLKDESRASYILQSSDYTNNNLKYLSFGYFSSLGDSSQGDVLENTVNNPSLLLTGFTLLPRGFGEEEDFDQNIYTHINVDDVNYTLTDISAERGYSLRKYTLFKPEGFFENSAYSTPSLSTNILSNFPTVKTNVYSYYSEDFFTTNISTDNPSDDVMIGENNVSFEVLDNYGEGVGNVSIRYKVDNETITLGSTDSEGYLSNQEISLPFSDVGKDITFSFVFSPEYGFAGNTINKVKTIESGYFISQENISTESYFYTLNNSVNFLDFENQGSYNILNSSNLSLTLEDISFEGSSDVFDVSMIEDNLSQENDVPKTLNSGDTTISTEVYLKEGLSEGGSFSPIFRNFIKVLQRLYILGI